MESFCRTCLRQMFDNTSVAPLRLENFHKRQLMFCIPEIDLRALSDAKLCKNCATTLNVSYKFKIKCREAECEVNKQHFDVTGESEVNKKISSDDKSYAVCRTCLTVVRDSGFPFLTERQFYKQRLMFCVPEMDLQTIHDVTLCNDCRKILDMLYMFKMKCLDIEVNMKELQKLHNDVDIRDLFVWYNTFIKNETSNLKNFRIKQEVDIVNTGTGEKLFKCSQCEYSSAAKYNLNIHMRTHTGEKPFKCSQCEYSSAHKCNLKKYIVVHTGKKPFKYSRCEHSFARKCNLNRHILIHTSEKPFKCLRCEYGAAEKYQLKVHMLTHSREKLFNCSQYEYSSASKCNLNIHMRTHTGAKPFKLFTLRVQYCKEILFKCAHVTQWSISLI